MPGAPLLRRTATHARHRTSLRRTLSHSAWNRRPGSALAARYSVCCKARTGSKKERSLAAGLAETALTELSSSTPRIDEVAALPSPAVVLSARLKQYYGRLRRPSGRSSFPGVHPVIEQQASGGTLHAGHRAGEGLSSSRRHYPNVPRPL